MNQPFNPTTEPNNQLSPSLNPSLSPSDSPSPFELEEWTTTGAGRPKVISDDYLIRLQELATHSPRQYGYPFERWTAQWLRRHLAQEFGVDISDRHVNRLLSRMGLSARQRRRQSRKRPYQPAGIRIHTLDPASFCQLPLLPLSRPVMH